MQISNINYSPKAQKEHRQTFGMALDMDEFEIACKLGRVAATQAKRVRPELEKIADKINVLVNPRKGSDKYTDSLDILVYDNSMSFLARPQKPIEKLAYKIITNPQTPFENSLHRLIMTPETPFEK